LRRARKAVLDRARSGTTAVTEILDLIERLRGASTTLALWQAEHWRQRRDIRRAEQALTHAATLAHTATDQRRVAIGRARLLEHQGRYREGLQVLEAPSLDESTHPIVDYDRVVLATLARVPEIDRHLQRLGRLNHAQRAVCRGFVSSDPGPFGKHLAGDTALRQRVLSALA
jgi:hypothetical protein